MELQLIGEGSKTIQVSEVAFSREFNESLVHQVVNAYLAAGRQGTHAQKNRSAVRGGGAKPWRQKGTGRARAGTIRSPLWRSGGVTFAASPRDYSQKVNKKMYRGAMQCILSELIRQDRLLVTDAFSMDVPKTAELVKRLKALSLTNVLIVTHEVDVNLFLSSRNLVNVDVRDAAGIDPVSMLKYKKVLVTSSALKKIEESLV